MAGALPDRRRGLSVRQAAGASSGAEDRSNKGRAAHRPQRGTSGSSRRAVSSRPARVAGCIAGKGWGGAPEHTYQHPTSATVVNTCACSPKGGGWRHPRLVDSSPNRHRRRVAQAIIDNGGFEYFYESDFVGTLDYGFFVSAYRRVGAETAAMCIETTAAMFPFGQPHLHEAKRLSWLDEARGNEGHLFVKLSRKVCGDQAVFPKLAQYVEANREAFNLA